MFYFYLLGCLSVSQMESTFVSVCVGLLSLEVRVRQVAIATFQAKVPGIFIHIHIFQGT